MLNKASSFWNNVPHLMSNYFDRNKKELKVDSNEKKDEVLLSNQAAMLMQNGNKSIFERVNTENFNTNRNKTNVIENQEIWNKKDDMLLVKLSKCNSKGKWKNISKQIKSKTSAECFYRSQQLKETNITKSDEKDFQVNKSNKLNKHKKTKKSLTKNNPQVEQKHANTINLFGLSNNIQNIQNKEPYLNRKNELFTQNKKKPSNKTETTSDQEIPVYDPINNSHSVELNASNEPNISIDDINSEQLENINIDDTFRKNFLSKFSNNICNNQNKTNYESYDKDNCVQIVYFEDNDNADKQIKVNQYEVTKSINTKNINYNCDLSPEFDSDSKELQNSPTKSVQITNYNNQEEINNKQINYRIYEIKDLIESKEFLSKDETEKMSEFSSILVEINKMYNDSSILNNEFKNLCTQLQFKILKDMLNQVEVKLKKDK